MVSVVPPLAGYPSGKMLAILVSFHTRRHPLWTPWRIPAQIRPISTKTQRAVRWANTRTVTKTKALSKTAALVYSLNPLFTIEDCPTRRNTLINKRHCEVGFTLGASWRCLEFATPTWREMARQGARSWDFQHYVPYLVHVHVHVDKNGNFWLRVRVRVHFSFSST